MNFFSQWCLYDFSVVPWSQTKPGCHSKSNRNWLEIYIKSVGVVRPEKGRMWNSSCTVQMVKFRSIERTIQGNVIVVSSEIEDNTISSRASQLKNQKRIKARWICERFKSDGLVRLMWNLNVGKEEGKTKHPYKYGVCLVSI